MSHADLARAQEILHDLGVPRISLRFCGVQRTDIEEGHDKWVRESARVGTIVKYPNDGRKLPHPKWDTFGPMVDHCGSCGLVKQNRVTEIYLCPGHPIE